MFWYFRIATGIGKHSYIIRDVNVKVHLFFLSVWVSRFQPCMMNDSEHFATFLLLTFREPQFFSQAKKNKNNSFYLQLLKW